MTPDDPIAPVYRFFTEVGIIDQLISTQLEAHLPGRMTATQFGILGHLARRPHGETPLQLSNAFQVPKTSMTHMLTGLESHGFISITPNPNDKRSKLARATVDGGRFLGTTMERLSKVMEPIMAELTSEPFQAALPHLERIREVLDRARDK